MSRSFIPAAAFGAMLLVVGCAKKEAVEPAAPTATPPAAEAEAPAAEPAAITADASVIDLMKNTIAPAADKLWGAVGTESTAEGTKDLAPKNDAEWAAVRKNAQLLIDASKALVDGRVVAHPGQKLKEPLGEGDLSPDQAMAAIGKEHAAFAAFATVMQGIGGDYLAAIDKKNVDAMTEVGGKLDEVCEACHTKFWYPGAPKPPVP